MNAGQIVIDRLFAKDLFPCCCGFLNDARMSVGRGANRHGVDGFVREQFLVIGSGFGHMPLVSDFFGGCAGNVGHSGEMGAGDAGCQIFRVNAANASAADDGDVKRVVHEVASKVQVAGETRWRNPKAECRNPKEFRIPNLQRN